jgi:hypothetical protein
MDKLGWSIERVAHATDEEMIKGLSQFETKTVVEPENSLQSRPKTNEKTVHVVDRLREAIYLKTTYISSEDLLQEDHILLKLSVDKDKQALAKALTSIRDQMNQKRTEETKKTKLRILLQKVVLSVGGVDDVTHLAEVDSQLLSLKTVLHGLQRLADGDQHTV